MANIGSSSGRGRFSDRLKKMRLNRLRRKKGMLEGNKEISYKRFLAVLAAIPLVVVDNVFDKTNTKSQKEKDSDGKVIDIAKKVDIHPLGIVEKKRRNRKKIEQIDVSVVKRKQAIFFKTSRNPFKKNIKKEPEIISKSVISPFPVNSEKEKDDIHSQDVIIQQNVPKTVAKKEDEKLQKNDINPAKVLEKKIIDLIKKDLVRIVNTLEIYESELYVLNEINNDEKTLIECRKNLAEVRKILEQIEDLKRKYDYLRDSYDFEYLLEFDNEELVDKIIELRDMFGNNEIRATVADYKLLDVYKHLYVSVDQINENVHKIEREKEKQEQKLAERDIDFEKLKSDVYNIERVNESYDSFVSEQNKLMADLSSKISLIDSREVSNYRVKGFGKFLFHSFKYFGLLMLNPLRGFLPSIATQTIITRNIVHNLHDKLKVEEEKHTVYDAVDYSALIYRASRDIDYTSGELDNTLDDLEKLKIEYNDRFRQYQGDFSEYYSVINRITAMQEVMINNRIKLEIIRNQLKRHSYENKHKLKLVRKLNDEELKRRNAA